MQIEDYNLPMQIPVMTLRGVVLFPKAMMPLRIFEERYKKMLNERLLDDRIFAIVCEREDVPAEEEHQQVVGKNDRQHGEDEEIEQAEETGVIFLFMHIADRVEMDQ